MGQPQTIPGMGSLNWRAIGGVGGSGALLLAAAWGFFNTQFEELRDRADRADLRNEAVVRELTEIKALFSRSENTHVRDRREIEIRIERLEEWRKLVPDGTGLDRWSATMQELWALRLQQANPALSVPDVRPIAGK